MTSPSPLQKAVSVAPGIRMRMGKSERNAPVVQICTLQAFAKGEIVEIESMSDLIEMYAFLGAAIARLRYADFTGATA